MAGTSGNNSSQIDEVTDEFKSILEKVVEDVGKASAIRQLIIGGTTGW